MTAAAGTHGRVMLLVGHNAVLDEARIAPPNVTTPEDLVNVAAWLFRDTRAGVLLLDRHNAETFGLPDDHAMGRIRDAGWTGGYSHGWARLRPADGRPKVHLGLLDATDDAGVPFLIRAPLEYLPDGEGSVIDFETTAASFAGWHQHTGLPWFSTPGLAGWDVLNDQLSTRDITVHHKEKERIGGPDGWEIPDNWVSHDAVIPHPHWHGYDLNRAGLTAMGVAEVCPWQLNPTGPIPFDRKAAGWWLIDVPAWNDPRLPDPAGRDTAADEKREHPRRRWVTTPTAALLAELAERGVSAGFDVIDSYTGKSRRVFREFAGVMESGHAVATERGHAALAEAFKRAPNEMVGLMNTGGRRFPTHRPDWAMTVAATKRTNLWRKLYRIGTTSGRWPMQVVDDLVMYGSDNPDPKVANPGLPIGVRPGQFKLAGTVDPLTHPAARRARRRAVSS